MNDFDRVDKEGLTSGDPHISSRVGAWFESQGKRFQNVPAVAGAEVETEVSGGGSGCELEVGLERVWRRSWSSSGAVAAGLDRAAAEKKIWKRPLSCLPSESVPPCLPFLIMPWQRPCPAFGLAKGVSFEIRRGEEGAWSSKGRSRIAPR